MLNYDKISSAVSESTFVSRVYYFEEIDSTNNFAKGLEDVSDFIVCTDYQRSGRGRFERTWESTKESNLTFAVRKTIPVSPVLNQSVNFFFSYYLFEAVHELLAGNDFNEHAKELCIKWPNDLLCRNKKIAGLLIESLPKSNRYVIGIGLNLNQEDFGTLKDAGSLKSLTGMKFDPTDVLIRILRKYSSNFIEFSEHENDEIFKKWKKSTKMIGKSCEFLLQDEEVKHGIINNLNQDGSIEILINNKKMRFFSGDIKLSSF